jgi:hypothetical protein
MDSQITLHDVSPMPVLITKKESQNLWKKSCTEDTSSVTTFASDQAFVDAILLDSRASLTDESFTRLIDARMIDMSSKRNHVEGTKKSMSVKYTHGLFYKQELVFVIRTTSHCDAQGTWGQSSSCVLTDKHLKIKITNKGRKADGSGWNARETRVYSLAGLIKQSAQARQNEMAQDLLP